MTTFGGSTGWCARASRSTSAAASSLERRLHARAREPHSPLVLLAEAVVLLRCEPAVGRDAGGARVAVRPQRALDRRSCRIDPAAPRLHLGAPLVSPPASSSTPACCARPARRSRRRPDTGSARCPASRTWPTRCCRRASAPRRTTPARPRPAARRSPPRSRTSGAHRSARRRRPCCRRSPTCPRRSTPARGLPRAAPERAAPTRRDLARLPGLLGPVSQQDACFEADPRRWTPKPCNVFRHGP